MIIEIRNRARIEPLSMDRIFRFEIDEKIRNIIGVPIPIFEVYIKDKPEKGWWYNGIWEKGTWENGSWKNGKWIDGLWRKGNWYSGKIYDSKKNKIRELTRKL